jgi:hypothetical protein
MVFLNAISAFGPILRIAGSQEAPVEVVHCSKRRDAGKKASERPVSSGAFVLHYSGVERLFPG